MSAIILDIAASFSARNGASTEIAGLRSLSSAIADDKSIGAVTREILATADVAAKAITRFRTRDPERKFILSPIKPNLPKAQTPDDAHYSGITRRVGFWFSHTPRKRRMNCNVAERVAKAQITESLELRIEFKNKGPCLFTLR